MAKILLVEDDQFIREIYLETLKSKGHDVEIALDGEEAYNKLNSTTFDLVLLDIILPKMTGIEVIKKLASEGKDLKSRVLFSTNSDAKGDLDDALELGAGYIIKSNLTPDDFSKKIEEFLEVKTLTPIATS